MAPGEAVTFQLEVKRSATRVAPAFALEALYSTLAYYGTQACLILNTDYVVGVVGCWVVPDVEFNESFR